MSMHVRGRQAVAALTLMELLLWMVLLGILAAIVVPNYQAARNRTGTRGCYAMQKTIAGAVEMYNLDKNTRRSDLGPNFYATLLSSGYLHDPPEDPEDPNGPRPTSRNYQFTAGGNRIHCQVHGRIQGESRMAPHGR